MSALLPRNWTIRVRLTVLYGGLFFLAGTVLLGVTYLLVKQSIEGRAMFVPDRIFTMGPGVRFDPTSIERIQGAVRQAQDDYRQETLDSLLTQGSIALGLVGVAAIGFGWLVADRVLRPVHRITELAGRIAGADSAGRGLHERIALRGPRDEIRQLADTFDAMLERLDRSFDGQRRFVANASHELRTPLAINRALIELAVTNPDAAAETRQLGEQLLTINARHERLIDGLLMLADSENAITERSAVDLAEVAAHVVRQTPAEDLEVLTELAPAPTNGDAVLLERLVQNLVENAVRHNRPGGFVRVSTGPATDRPGVELTVENSGPPVPGYEVETIFQPFRRLSGERASLDRGFGLGLSIVRAVARAHGGTVTAIPRPADHGSPGGLTVRVHLPPSPG